jgi:hypothetical protein
MEKNLYAPAQAIEVFTTLQINQQYTPSLLALILIVNQ